MARVNLGEVALEARETCKGDKSGYPIVGLEHITPEEIQLKNWDDDSENTFTKRFHKGDVLFGRRRAYLKKAALAPFDGICSGDITVIRAMPDKIVPELLPFIIQNDDLFDFAVGRSAGSLSPRVKWEHLQKYSFELPDMDKQRELANVLWAIEDTRSGYQELLTATEELVKSRFIEMFGTYITDSSRHKKLKDVCNFIDYRGKTPEKSDSGIPLITAKNVRDNHFSPDPQEFIPIENYETVMTRGIPKVNDVLFTTEAPLGNVCRIPDLYDKFCVGQRIVTIQPHPDILIPEYLERTLLSDDFQEKIWQQATGSTVKGIRSKRLIELTIPIPPLGMQKKYADFVTLTDKSKFVIN